MRTRKRCDNGCFGSYMGNYRGSQREERLDVWSGDGIQGMNKGNCGGIDCAADGTVLMLGLVWDLSGYCSL